MIYTVTFNPSIDYIVRVKNFKPDTLNRTYYEQILPGGKGINVSIVLGNLGRESTALGFVAGFTGRELEDRLADCGVKSEFIHVREGFTRINVKMKSDGETEINGMGPKGTLVNSIGAGDSMVAGFMTGYLDTGDYDKAFRTGLCAGSASAFSTDLATKEEVEALLKTLS